jgi:L,D-transpeptidase ErfK/SrfK
MSQLWSICLRNRSVILLGLFVLAGCSTVDESISTGAEPFGPVIADQPPINSNRFVINDEQQVVGEIQVVTARYEDTFADFARAYGVGYDELVRANQDVDPWLPGEGTEVVLPTRFILPDVSRKGIVLNVAAKRLFFYEETELGQPRVVHTFPIGIGRVGWSTPTGDTTIIGKARDPVWFVPASIRKEHAEAGDPLPSQVPAGPDNPLGAHVLRLGIPGYLIHGTNKPAGVGMRVSHGCVRLFPEDIEWLFEQVDRGVHVSIVNTPYLLGWDDDDLLLEAYPPLDEDERDWSESLANLAKSDPGYELGSRYTIEQDRLYKIIDEARGYPVSILADRPDVGATVQQARHVTNIVVHDEVAEKEIVEKTVENITQ